MPCDHVTGLFSGSCHATFPTTWWLSHLVATRLLGVQVSCTTLRPFAKVWHFEPAREMQKRTWLFFWVEYGWNHYSGKFILKSNIFWLTNKSNWTTADFKMLPIFGFKMFQTSYSWDPVFFEVSFSEQLNISQGLHRPSCLNRGCLWAVYKSCRRFHRPSLISLISCGLSSVAGSGRSFWSSTFGGAWPHWQGWTTHRRGWLLWGNWPGIKKAVVRGLALTIVCSLKFDMSTIRMFWTRRLTRPQLLRPPLSCRKSNKLLRLGATHLVPIRLTPTASQGHPVTCNCICWGRAFWPCGWRTSIVTHQCQINRLVI